MKREKAMQLFHGVEKYNCAQAILIAFREEYGVAQEQIDASAALGRGKADEGRCGALHAGRALLDDASSAQNLENQFAAAAGSAKCREIRKLKRISCMECVGVAADLIEKIRK
ncbi:MAG: C-GCAxxG-C-C family (seleno)protein [Candidatus Omnitrophota bacterium]